MLDDVPFVLDGIPFEGRQKLVYMFVYTNVKMTLPCAAVSEVEVDEEGRSVDGESFGGERAEWIRAFYFRGQYSEPDLTGRRGLADCWK